MKIWSQVSLEMRSSSVFDTQQRGVQSSSQTRCNGDDLAVAKARRNKMPCPDGYQRSCSAFRSSNSAVVATTNEQHPLFLKRILTSQCRTCDTQNLQLTCDSASTSAILNCTFMQEIINPAEDRITCAPNWFRGHAILRSDGMG
jgi:hypothetical protein